MKATGDDQVGVWSRPIRGGSFDLGVLPIEMAEDLLAVPAGRAAGAIGVDLRKARGMVERLARLVEPPEVLQRVLRGQHPLDLAALAALQRLATLHPPVIHRLVLFVPSFLP